MTGLFLQEPFSGLVLMAVLCLIPFLLNSLLVVNFLIKRETLCVRVLHATGSWTGFVAKTVDSAIMAFPSAGRVGSVALLMVVFCSSAMRWESLRCLYPLQMAMPRSSRAPTLRAV